MTAPDIDLLARTAYETGIDPTDYATRHVIEAHIVAHLGTRGVLAGDSTEAIKALSRRILGDLLDAGWSAPGGLGIPDRPETPEGER
jgi:hypothetical protein